MQFLLTAYDGTDAGAQARRQAARPNHIALGDRMREEGTYLYGVAILNESGQMIGSAMIMDFPSREDLDRWLEIEPYVMGKVWERTEIQPCRVGPTFARNLD